MSGTLTISCSSLSPVSRIMMRSISWFSPSTLFRKRETEDLEMGIEIRTLFGIGAWNRRECRVWLFAIMWCFNADHVGGLTQWFVHMLKGIVHPKMKILLSFTLPQVVPNLYECVCSAEHKRKIFWRMWETEQFWGTIDFHSIFFPTMEVNGAPKQPDYKLILQISSFVFGRTKKFIQVWNYLRVSKLWFLGKLSL